MKRDVELAKRLLESKGYKVSKKVTRSNESYTYSGHNVSDDAQQYLVTVIIGGTDGDGESGMVAPDYYTELVSAMSEDDAKRQVEKGLNPGDGISDIHLATEDEISAWESDAYYYIDEAHTVELYKTHTGEPERKRFSDYKSAKEFADSQIENYEEISITIPTVNGPSTVNSWSKSDGWFRNDESRKIDKKKKMNESYDKFKIGDVIVGNESGNFYKVKGITTTHYICDDLQGHGTSYLYKNRVNRSFSLSEDKQMKESSDTPHTESYKGYSIQSYDDFGATIYKNGKKIREFENIDDAREYIDELEESENPLRESILGAMKKLHESVDEDEDEDEEDPWEPFSKGRYRVYGSNSIGRMDAYNIHMLDTDDPGEAIEAWFRINKSTPSETYISTQSKSNAQALIDWAAENIDKVESWYDKYGCHTEKEYLLRSIRDKYENGLKYFYEGEIGDTIDPFSIG